MHKPLKYFSILSSALLLILALIEGNAFIKRKEIAWSNKQSATWNDFRGYPNVLSEFDAGISSYFTYNLPNNNIDSLEVTTFMKTHLSWVKKQHINSGYLLRHELYHFNISELIARKFRKVLSELPNEKRNEKIVNRLYNQYMGELGLTQEYYDRETNHSLEIERQMDWEYTVDSLLNDLEIYASIKVASSSKAEPKQKYYRKIALNAWHNIEGQYPIDSSVAANSKHFRFFYKGDTLVKLECWDRNKKSTDEQFNISSIVFSYDNNKAYTSFFDVNDEHTKNTNGVYGQKMESDSTQLIVSNLNENGEIMNNNVGIGFIEWKLDHKKRKEIGQLFDADKNRISDKLGFYIVKYKYDKNDNLIEYANYNHQNKRKNLADGASFYKYFFDANNNTISIQSFDSLSMLCANENGVAIFEYRYDTNGFIIRQNRRSTDGRLLTDDDGKSIQYLNIDNYGNILSEGYYGQNKNLIISAEKIGLIERNFDSLGRVIEIRNYDAYKQPLNDIVGKCSADYIYSKNNLVLEEKHFYADTLLEIHHLKTIKYTHDADENILSQATYNELNAPMLDSNGIFITKYDYDKNKNLTKVTYFNDSNQLTTDSYKTASYEYTYDVNNNRIQVAYFGVNNKPADRLNNIALEKFTFNKQNTLTEIKYFDAKGNYVQGDEGAEIVRWKYDSKGNIIEQCHFNGNGELSTDSHSVSKYVYTYDSRNNNIETHCYNKRDQLVITENSGIAIIRHSFNKNNALIETSFHNFENDLEEIPEGYAIERAKYNSVGLLMRREYLSKYEAPVITSFGYASVDFLYDLNQNVIAQIFRDDNNDLIACQEGYAILNWIYDRNGDVINSQGFDANEYYLTQIDRGSYRDKIQGLNHQNNLPVDQGNTRIQTTYFKNGQKRSEVMYIEGKLEGKYITWYETGELEGEINYLKGKREGLMYEYAINGQKIREMQYENNNYIHGSEKEWYNNGTLKSEYVNGEFVEYDIAGNRMANK